MNLILVYRQRDPARLLVYRGPDSQVIAIHSTEAAETVAAIVGPRGPEGPPGPTGEINVIDLGTFN